MDEDSYRIWGEIDAPEGTGIVGTNAAETGDAVGVEGRTDSPEGYGLATPDDARVGGALTADTVRTTAVESVQFAGGHPGETGGERIQNALDALPERGGTVVVGSRGPDTVEKNQTGFGPDEETAVWAVEEPIVVDSGQWLVGAGPGWHEDATGTALVADANIGEVVQYTGTYLNGAHHLRIDGNELATACARLGNGRQNDFLLRNTMIHGGGSHGVTLEGQRNFWVDQCWIEQCGTGFGDAGVAVLGPEVVDSIWITDSLFFDNQHDVMFDQDPGSTVAQVWLSNMRTDGPHRHCIAQRPDSPLADIWIVRPHIENAGKASDDDWDAMNFAGPVETLEIQSAVVRGHGTTRYAIHRELGEWTDCSVTNLRSSGTTRGDVAAILGGTATTRTVVNGWGVNEGDPSSTGQWSGHGREGASVYDTVNDSKYTFIANGWR